MRITFCHLLLNQPVRPHSPPLGPLYLVAVLRQAEFEVSFRQFAHLRGQELRVDDLVEFLDVDTDILAVSCMINALPLLVAALARVRARRPELRVVAGGPGFGGIARPLVAAFPCFDAVAGGEGEAMVRPLMRALAGCTPLTSVPGICFRDGDVIRETPRPPRIDDLDALPDPAFDLVRFEDYHNVPLITSRGCPFHCSFCDVAPAWNRLHRRRSVGHVIGEIEHLRDHYHVRRLGIVDDIFVIQRPWVEEFCARMIRRRVDVGWRCTGHINLMTDRLLSLMRDAGCESVFFGVESGSDVVLRRIRKNFTIAKVFDTVERTRRFLDVHANLIWGFPGETLEEIGETMEARRRLEDLGAQTSLVFLAPLASAALYRESPVPLRFEPDSPNIFYADYASLAEIDRPEIEAMIAAHPDVFCAFHHYENPLLDQLWDLVRFDEALTGASRDSSRDSAALEPAAWEGV